VFDANLVLEAMRDLLQRAVGPEIALVFRLDPGSVPSCFDAAQFEAAVMNLVLNARDACVDTGRACRITVTTGTDRASRQVVVSVNDTGIGMAADVAAEAFEPFFTTKEPGVGSGLGLAQVWGFATGAGGTAAIESVQGQGTTVAIRMPLAAGVVTPDEARRPSPRFAVAPPGCTVLVVEDDEAVRTTSALILRQLGYEVLAAAGPEEALELLRSSARIDVLFSDVSMPGGMSGVGLAAAAQACRPGIRLLLTSGYPAGAPEARPGHDEAFDILPKPYRREELQARLRGLLDAPA
jgi:CheY-like chemotaxis protein